MGDDQRSDEIQYRIGQGDVDEHIDPVENETEKQNEDDGLCADSAGPQQPVEDGGPHDGSVERDDDDDRHRYYYFASRESFVTDSHDDADSDFHQQVSQINRFLVHRELQHTKVADHHHPRRHQMNRCRCDDLHLWNVETCSVVSKLVDLS